MDKIRFDIVPTGEQVDGFELLVHVNDVEVTAAGAGMGMDPFTVLIPDNRLVAVAEPTVGTWCVGTGCSRSWQRPQDTVARRILERVDRAALGGLGFEVSWVTVDHRTTT